MDGADGGERAARDRAEKDRAADTAVRKTPDTLRSARWFAPDDLRSFGHRSRMMQMGLGPEDWAGRPVIAILNTWSELQPCHMHFRDRVEDVKRGVLQAGGLPLEIPALSLSESFLKPTSMLYRNMLAMDVEELIRAQPVDGVVLMGGCDKTTPGLLMGATSAGVPAIFLPAGPMLRGNWKGKVLGSGSDAWKYWDERRAGKISDSDWFEMEAGIARSYGHCMTLGTASTMTAIAEAIGMTLPGASSIPAADVGHMRMASECGRRIVEMVWEDLTPARIQTRAAFENGIAVAMAMGCSTNAVIHVIAQARRAGVDIGLEDFDKASRTVPVVANIRPSGDKYLMEDFFYAGGLARPDDRDCRASPPRCADRERQHAGRKHRRCLRRQRRRDPAARQSGLSGGLAGGAHRQPRAGRLRDEARRLRPAFPQARRSGAGLRRLSGHEGGHRRRRPRRHARSRAHPQERRAAWRSGHARVGDAADPEEAGEAGRPRHAAHFRRAHERHQLRRLRAARGA